MVAASEKFHMYGDLPEKLFSRWLTRAEPCPREILVEGPAGTGKTRTILEFLLHYGETFPRSQIMFLRDTRAAMTETLLAEWENVVLGPIYPECIRGQQRRDRDKYVLPNGSEYVLRGFDNESKLFSGQCNVIYFNEATELKSEEKWETLHRAARAAAPGGQPFNAIIADCNPRHKGHWLNVRASVGPEGERPRMHRIRTRFQDNPRWWNHAIGDWTPDGRANIVDGLLANTTGVTHSRLGQGLWEDNTGMVLPQWMPEKHWIYATVETNGDTRILNVKDWANPVEIRWCFGAMDCGFENAGVFGVWGVDIHNRMFEMVEIYQHHWTHGDWAEQIVPLAREYRLQGIVADHDKALIAAVNRALINAGMPPVVRIADKTLGMSGDKGKQARIDLMRTRLQKDEIFYLRGANRSFDEALRAIRPPRPYMTPMELPNLVFEEFKYGEDDIAKADKVDKSKSDHGFDMSLYAIAFATGKALMQSVPAQKYAPGTAGAMLNHAKYEQVPNRTSARAAFRTWQRSA